MSLVPLVLEASTFLLPLAEKAADTGSALDLNAFISGGSGVGVGGAVILVVKIFLDKTLPSRSDQRANVQVMLDSMNNTIKILQEEKSADSKRLEDKQARIDALEVEAEKDYDRISELRAEIIDLRQRLAVKDRHINALIAQLKRVGIIVAGVEIEDTDLDITFTKEEIQGVQGQQANH